MISRSRCGAPLASSGVNTVLFCKRRAFSAFVTGRDEPRIRPYDLAKWIDFPYIEWVLGRSGMTRTGLESEAVKRLVYGIEDDAMREILVRCLEGSISPSIALMQMLTETEDAVVVRAAVDDVTRRAATLSRSGDNLVRDRVDDLTQLVVENESRMQQNRGRL